MFVPCEGGCNPMMELGSSLVVDFFSIIRNLSPFLCEGRQRKVCLGVCTAIG